jgi:Flp pilus assembly protein TadG
MTARNPKTASRPPSVTLGMVDGRMVDGRWIGISRSTIDHGSARRRRGAVALELTLSLAFVLIPMLLGIWEIGCLLTAQQTLVEAVREGGRQASTGLMTNAQVQQVVINYLSVAGVTTTNVVVTVTNTGSGTDASTATQLDPLVIKATLPFKNVDWTFTQHYVTDSQVLTTSCTFFSMVDTPYTVSTTAPTQ